MKSERVIRAAIAGMESLAEKADSPEAYNLRQSSVDTLKWVIGEISQTPEVGKALDRLAKANGVHESN